MRSVAPADVAKPDVALRSAEGAPRLSILVNRDWFFLSHFLDRAVLARKSGYEVVVICEATGREQEISAAGLVHVPLRIDRQNASPWALLNCFHRLKIIYKESWPSVVWHIGLVSIVIGTAAAWLNGIRSIVNAPVGMGWTFASGGWKAALLRPFLRIALKIVLNPRGSKVVFENADDWHDMIALRAARPGDAVVIRGAGVDVGRYKSVPALPGVPIVLFAARLIWEKGVREFVEAARLLRQRGVVARFQIAGGIDHESASAVPQSALDGWVSDGIVEWLGRRDDMPEVLGACHVFCLPTWYREGLPKVILEAMACGRPVVTTDMPGCREAVRQMDNGVLVAPKNIPALADAISLLLSDATLRARMGARGRERAETEFSSERVCRETLAVFDQLARRPS